LEDWRKMALTGVNLGIILVCTACVSFSRLLLDAIVAQELC